MKTIAIMVAFGLLTLVFFWDVIVDDRYLIDIDPGLYDPWRSYPAEAGEPGGSLQPDSFLSYYPAGASLNQSIASGRFHLWNPRILGGMPFLANPQTRATYPLRLMLARADPARAMGYDVAIHVFLAMVGMYLFLTSLGLRAPGAFLGAVAFAFSSFFYVRYGHPTIIGAAAWMPFFFYSLQVALKRERLGIVLLTASLAMGYLAGFPQVFLFGVLALALYAFYLALDCPSGERRRALSKTVRIIGVSGLLSALIVSIQLIPFLELYTNSVGLHYDFEYIAKFLMIPPVLMLRSIFPAFFGQPAQGTDWSGLTRDAAHPYNPEYAVYGGIGALIVALAALPLLRKSPHVRVMVLLLVLGVAVAVSRPVARIGYLLLPMLRASRVSRVAVIPCFSLAALAAIGFSGLAGGEGLGGKKRIFLAAGAVTLFAVLFAAYIQFAGAPVVEKLAEKAQTIPGDVWEETHVLVRSGTIREWAQGDTARWLGYERRVLSRQLVIIALSATVLILLAAWPNRRHRVVIAVLFVLVAVYDLLGTARAYRVSQPPGSAPETPGITALKGVLGDQGQWRIKAFQPKVGDRLPFPPNTNQIFGISSLQGTHTINTKSFDAYRETYVDSKMEPAVGEAVIPTVGTGITWLANRLDDLMGIRCVIAERGESRYAASSILRSVLDKKVTSARLKMLRLDGDNKLALLQASGETLAFKARFLPVRSLCFSMGFDSQAGAPGDSVSFTLTCDGETGNARLERAFDRLHDAGKWHEATLDIGPIGLSMVDMELSVEVAGSGDPVMAGWGGFEFVAGECPVTRSRDGDVISLPGPGKCISMMLHSGAREVPLVIHYDDGTATKRLFSFPPGIRSRRVRIDLTRPPGEHLVVRSDSTCRIAGVRQIAAEWGIDRDCHLIYEGDLCIYENPCASSRGVCLDRDRVAVRGSSEGDMLELSRIEDVRSVECGECRLLSDEPEEILLDVRTARPCYLVFQDIHYPGWKAFADGAETEILKTDIGVRALELDQGAHKVAMVYRPASFKFGLILTCIGLVLTLLFSLGKRLSGSAGR